MLRPPRRRTADRATGVVAVVVAAAALLAACSSDAAESQTEPIGVDADSPMNELLLTPETVAVFPGFEGAEIRDLDQVPLFENPDPRGPCGAPVPAPSFETAAARVIGGGTINLVQFADTASPAYEEYIDALIADKGPPCEDYSSTTNTGETQRVTAITVYDASGDGVRGVTWTNLVEVEGRTVNVGTIVLHVDDAVTFVQVQSASAIPAEAMQVLAGLAVTRLRGVQ